MINIEKIYEYRSYIRQLYDKDTTLVGDLVNSIIDDINDSAEKVDIRISGEYIINIIFKETTTNEQINTILSSILIDIQSFILDNVKDTSITDINELHDFIEFVSNGKLIFDLYTVGFSVKYSL